MCIFVHLPFMSRMTFIIMPLVAGEIIMPLEACEIIMPLEAGDGFKFKFVCCYRKCPLLFVLLHHRHFQLFACW